MKNKLKSKKKMQPKVKTVSGSWKVQVGYYLMMALPVFVIILFSYIPLAGLYMAFTDFKPVKGMFGSEFVGLKWFKMFFGGRDIGRIVFNTVYYSLFNILFISIVGGVVLAILLYEVNSRRATKVFQTTMMLPGYLSWTVMAACLYLFLDADEGYLNQFLRWIGVEVPGWYREAGWWRIIIPVMSLFKGVGGATVYYYAALLTIDNELFDAARIDGATRLQQIKYISLPAIKGVACITLLLSMDDVLHQGISPFYELTFDQGTLYETTQVVGTYLKNGLEGGRYSYTTAVGLAETIVSVIMLFVSNSIVKKIDPDSSLF